MTKRLFTYGIALALLAGCSADDTATPGSAAPGATDGLLPVRLTISTTDFRAPGDADHTAATRAGSASGVADHAATRATSDPHTAFAAGEEVYLSVRNDAATTASPFPGGQTGTSETTTRTIAAATVNSGVTGFNETLYYPENGHTFDLCAIYPSTANSTITVAADQSTAAGYQASDLLYAYVAGIASTQRTTAQTLTFRHMMAQLKITVTKDATVASITSVTLKAVKPTVTVTPFNPPHTLLGAASGSSDITILGATTAASTDTYTVLPPQALTSSADLIEVAYTDQIGTSKMARFRLPSDLALNSGIRYDMAITMTDPIVQGTITLTLPGWTDGGSASFDYNTPLTLELISAGSTTIKFDADYEYRTYTGGSWSNWATCSADINLSAEGDKVQFRGSSYPGSSGDCAVIDCSRDAKALKVYGNVMSLMNYGSLSSGTYNFSRLFYNNKAVADAAGLILPTSLREGCYEEMFRACKNLETPPALSATTLAPSCYSRMFQGCTSLESAPELPATTLSSSCYDKMFLDCTSLVVAPQLPAAVAQDKCYYQMFSGCTLLVTAPHLPATTLAEECYWGMFDGCTSLVQVQSVLNGTLAQGCYREMFQGCTSLAVAPALPKETLQNSCYHYMFKGCIALTSAPSLPATVLAKNCYQGMFEGCTSLVATPKLPAPTLMENCYASMFNGCTGLKDIAINAANGQAKAVNCGSMFSGAGADSGPYTYYGDATTLTELSTNCGLSSSKWTAVTGTYATCPW